MPNRIIKAPTIAIVLAAGSGKRMDQETAKQYMKLKTHPVIAYTLSVFERCEAIDEVVVIIPPDTIEYFESEILDRYRFKKVLRLVVGGHHRQQSVYNGIVSVKDKDSTLVIHDGVRPFVTEKALIDLVAAAKEHKAACAVTKVNFTVKRVQKSLIKETVDRKELFLAHTPQAFSYEVIHKAHVTYQDGDQHPATDDAELVERIKVPVHAVEIDDLTAFKLTTPNDILIAEAIIHAWGIKVGAGKK